MIIDSYADIIVWYCWCMTGSMKSAIKIDRCQGGKNDEKFNRNLSWGSRTLQCLWKDMPLQQHDQQSGWWKELLKLFPFQQRQTLQIRSLWSDCKESEITGKQNRRVHPLTGQPEKTWKMSLFRLFSGAYVLFIIDTYSTNWYTFRLEKWKGMCIDDKCK